MNNTKIDREFMNSLRRNSTSEVVERTLTQEEVTAGIKKAEVIGVSPYEAQTAGKAVSPDFSGATLTVKEGDTDGVIELVTTIKGTHDTIKDDTGNTVASVDNTEVLRFNEAGTVVGGFRAVRRLTLSGKSGFSYENVEDIPEDELAVLAERRTHDTLTSLGLAS